VKQAKSACAPVRNIALPSHQHQIELLPSMAIHIGAQRSMRTPDPGMIAYRKNA